MRTRTKIKKKHLWITEQEDQKLKEIRKLAKLSNSEIFSKTINEDYKHTKLILSISNELKKQGTNLNQIAKYTNTERAIDIYVKDRIETLINNTETILRNLKSL